MKILGLTGAIASGKTTTASMFMALSVPVFNADEAVHAAYSLPEVQAKIHKIAPDVMENTVLNRQKLRALVIKQPDLLPKLEVILHMAITAKRNQFIEKSRTNGADFCVLDVPLLFETGLYLQCDAVACCHAPNELLIERAKARQDFNHTLWQILNARHWSQAEKLAHSQFHIDTSQGIEFANEQVQDVVETMST